jgi:hypothetical protein
MRYQPAIAQLPRRLSLLQSHRWIGFAFLVWAFGCACQIARCQDVYPTGSIGVPTFTTALPVENGIIQLGMGDLHLEIPLGSFPQRNGKKFTVSLMYDSNIWFGSSGSNSYPVNVPMSG